MKYAILQKPDFSVVKVAFEAPGEEILAEGSAMVAKHASVAIKTELRGGVLSAAKRKMLGGESLFQNTFTASAAGDELWLAPGADGDIEVVECTTGMPMFLSSGAFLACAPSVVLDTQWGGARGFFSGAGLFLLKASGSGPLFFSAYGGIHRIDVGAAGYVCDTSHIVAFSGSLDYSVRSVGGLKSLFLSGEGLVCEFSGHGDLFVSTRNPGALASFLHPFRRIERDN